MSNRLTDLYYDARRDVKMTRIIINEHDAKMFQHYKREYDLVCAIIDCIRKPYEKVE